MLEASVLLEDVQHENAIHEAHGVDRPERVASVDGYDFENEFAAPPHTAQNRVFTEPDAARPVSRPIGSRGDSIRTTSDESRTNPRNPAS
jgi:hypothetical protein